jgi:hypothetical protein
MAAIEDPRYQTAQRIYDWYERNADDGHREHLGGSLIGHACRRHLWLTFRWAFAKPFTGRMLRLFETGQREEARVVANLRAIGCEVHDTQPDGAQWRVSTFGGHFSGSLDGALRGVPEAATAWHVLEAKTHNLKSFTALTKDGVQKSKPMHYAQMQTYMGFTGMDRALYFAVCKDNDQIHTERIHFDAAEFKRLVDKAESIIFASEPPERISNDPAWYECKMCDHYDLCHGTVIPDPNCRTCAHSTPTRDGAWNCERHEHDLNTVGQQKDACQAHRYIPILLERIGSVVDADPKDNWIRYSNNVDPGKTFTNGSPPAGFSSVEIHAAAQSPGILDDADPLLSDLRSSFGGQIVKA